MLEANGFFDYCVSEKCLGNNNYETTIKLLYNFGYRTVAINQILDTVDVVEPKKKKKKGEPREPSECVPEPYQITPVRGCEDMKILNRLTIVFANQDAVHKIVKSPVYKKYNIVAVLPTTLPAMMFTCSNFSGDILCFNPENKNNFKRNRKMFKQLIDKGYHFEIPYGPAIEDSSKRKNIIHLAHLYHTYFKSRNIIISSSATDLTRIRGPYDIINLALIFGLNQQQAKDCITHCGRQVYINSVGRRHGKAVMFVENIEEDAPREKENHSSNVEVIDLLVESDEDMETDQPALKRVKQ